MAAERPASWSQAQRLLHWAITALVLLAAPLGVNMVALPFRQLLLKFLLYQLHKTIGITAFVLALGQLALHWRRGRPAWVEGLPDWQRRAASAVHAVQFGLLCVTPILGYLTAATAPARIPTLFLGVIPRAVQRCAASWVSPGRNRSERNGGRGREAGFPNRRNSDSWGGNRGGGCRDRVYAAAATAGGGA
jgi:cytochrome b561